MGVYAYIVANNTIMGRVCGGEELGSGRGDCNSDVAEEPIFIDLFVWLDKSAPFCGCPRNLCFISERSFPSQHFDTGLWVNYTRP